MTKEMSECNARIAILNESDILGPSSKNSPLPYLFTNNFAKTPSKMNVAGSVDNEEKIADF